ncbi:MAG TPA: hypothetical protein VFL93_07910 [Longimicrobiaceae bacterium]|nr:hypothetical protein [Longimicrobiaceae bacterium]
MKRAFLVLLLPVALPAARTPLSAQAPPPLSARDSSRALHHAREEQARFERARRSHLPEVSGGDSGTCDEHVGRFCLTYTDEDDDWRPPPEPAPVADARERLLGVLDSTAALIPGDDWVAGQRVRYLVEAHRFPDAVAAARDCRGTPWWCAALDGFALHHAGDAARADSAFSRMLGTMPADERHEWTDLSDILEGKALGRYRRLRGAARDDFAARFWRLADPFFSRPGNEVRSEHFSRNVLDQLQDRAKRPEVISWGGDLRELLLRYGWPIGWERLRQSPYATAEAPSLLTHYGDTEQYLLPPDEALADSGITHGAWDQDPLRARTGYDIPAGDSTLRWIYPLPHQLAVFRRGDSALVVAAYSLPADSFPAGARVDAGLALLADDDSAPLVSRSPGAALEGALTAEVPSEPLLLSLEIVSDSARRAARDREGLRIAPHRAGALAVSDLLLLRPGEPLPDSLAAAVADARGSAVVHPGESVGVYWEVYGLGEAGVRELTLSLRLGATGKGILRRIAERVGLARGGEPVRVKWKEPAAPGSYLPRALLIQVPGEMAPGDYRLELTVEPAGHAELTTARDVRVAE